MSPSANKSWGKERLTCDAGEDLSSSDPDELRHLEEDAEVRRVVRSTGNDLDESSSLLHVLQSEDLQNSSYSYRDSSKQHSYTWNINKHLQNSSCSYVILWMTMSGYYYLILCAAPADLTYCL